MAIWNDMLFVPTCQYEGEAPLFGLDADNGGTLWQNNDAYEGYWDSSPVVVDSVIYICGQDGRCRGIEAITGTTVWEVVAASEYDLTATPAYYGGRLFFGNESGSYYCLDASDGSEIWSVPGTQHGSSAVADGIVFYGEYDADTSMVLARDTEDGQEIWSYPIASPYGLQSSPAVTDGIVYFAGTDWNLYAFGSELKFTYLDDLFAEVGANELIVTSYDDGVAAAADTTSFTVTQTGLIVDPMNRLSLQVSPNPFGHSTEITFSLPKSADARVTIYDLTGRLVRDFGETGMAEGEHELIWDGRDDSGEHVSTGLYLCRVRTPDATETTGICMLR
jgi:glucose dehydrogenase